MEEEFSGPNIKKSLIRTALITLAIILFPAGFISAVATKSKIIGLLVTFIGIGIVSYSIYQSYNDTSKFKWLNIVFKGFLMLLGLAVVFWIFVTDFY